MAGITNDLYYDASESDFDEIRRKPLPTTRKKKRKSRDSKSYSKSEKRFLTWRKGYQQRLSEVELSPGSSDDDCDDDSVQMASPSQPAKNWTRDGQVISKELFRKLRRPSEVIRAIEEGSAPDAGLNEEQRAVHERHLAATKLRVENIGAEGHLRPISSGKRHWAKLHKYTEYLEPPEEDKRLMHVRVDESLLSRYYRGTLLRVYRPGDERRLPKRVNENITRGASMSDSLSERGNSDCIANLAYPRSSESEFHMSSGAEMEVDSGNSRNQQAPAATDELANSGLGQRAEMLSGTNCEMQRSDPPQRTLKTAFGSAKVLYRKKRQRRDDEVAFAEPPKKQKLPSSRDEVTMNSFPAAASFPKEDFIRELLEQSESELSSHNTPSREDGITPSTSPVPSLPGSPAAPLDVDLISEEVEVKANLLSPEKPESPEDKIAQIFEFAKTNPDYFCDFSNAKPPSACEEKFKDLIAGPKEAEHAAATPPQQKSLTPFEKEKRIALAFYHGSDKKPADVEDLQTLDVDANAFARNGDVIEVDEEDPRESLVNPKVSRMMQNMGFKGRLGANEDGLIEAIRPEQIQGRSGLGSKPLQALGSSRDHTNSSPKKVHMMGSASSRSGPAVFALDGSRNDNIGSSRKGNASGNARPPKRKRSGRKNVTMLKVLDENDDYETEQEYKSDNGRRAILVDFDLLIKDAQERRIEAVKKMMKMSEGILTHNYDILTTLRESWHDMSDFDIVGKLMEKHKCGSDDLKRRQLLDRLDDGYKLTGKPILNQDLWQSMRESMEEMRFGLYSSGSQSRLDRELEEIGLLGKFSQNASICARAGEDWPYSESWRELACRLGVPARQCILLLRTLKTAQHTIGGRVAGSILGACTILCGESDEKGFLEICRGGKVERVATALEDALSDKKDVLGTLLSRPIPSIRRKRVMAMNSEDMLWHSGCVEFTRTQRQNGHGEVKLIKFYKLEQRAWVDADDVMPLTRKEFRRVEAADFPGLIDPDDTGIL